MYPFDSLPQQQGGHCQEQAHIKHGSDSLGPFETKAFGIGGLAQADFMCAQSDQDRAEITQVVQGIGNKGQTVGKNTGHQFGQKDDEVQPKRYDQPGNIVSINLVFMGMATIHYLDSSEKAGHGFVKKKSDLKAFSLYCTSLPPFCTGTFHIRRPWHFHEN